MKTYLPICIAFLLVCNYASAATLYVATNGNDAWSGKLLAPNTAKTDGPLATITRARDAMRNSGDATSPKIIYVRGGTYYLREPVTLTPADSGVSFLAYRNEKPVLSGGRTITGWKKGEGNLWTAPVPEAKAGTWDFRLLRVGNEPQTLARYPNFDLKNPYQGGWSFVVYNGPKTGTFGAGVANIHTPGDWIEWKVNIPTDGNYNVWFYYAAENKPYGNDNMAGRTTMRVDQNEPVTLQNLPDTGSFGTSKWSQTATIPLTKGEHTLRWTNVKGGGLNFDAFALSDDPNWTPQGTNLAKPGDGKNVLVVQAEAYSAAQGKEMVVAEATVPAYNNRFQFRPGDIKEYPRSPNPEIHIFPAWGWVSTILYPTRIDRTTHTVHVEENSNASEELRVGNRYYISNVFEELDQPGEWFLDKAAGTLYLWPKTTNFRQSNIVAPVLDRIFDLKGSAAQNQWVERISIKGFEFRDTTYSRNFGVYSPMDATIWLSGARGCVIEGNRFIGVGGYAARLEDRSANNEFVGNEVAYNGQGGVVLNGPVATQPQNNLIAGNWMHHIGQVHKHVAGVYAVTASGTRVAHNRFEYLPRYAISFKGFNAENYSHNNTAEYNDILMTNLETNDTGAIETLGREQQDTGNVIQYNRILDVIGLKTTPEGKMLSPHFTWGIYLDDYSSGTIVRGNLVARHDWGGGCIHGGRNNVFENNIFIEGITHQMRYQVRDEFCVNNKFLRNIIYYSYPKADLFKHTGNWRPEVLSESNHNLFWHAQGEAVFREPNATPSGSLEKWREAGYDRNSLVADPLFTNMAKDDYRLKPGSPALKLGFQPLPWHKIGLQGYTRSWKQSGR